MPTLPREVDIYPFDLLDRPELGREEGLIWWALYCRSRQEKKLMRKLQPLEVPFYSPVVEKRSKLPSGRIRRAYLPLFSNYVFVYGDEDHRRAAQETGCVSRWLPVGQPEQLTEDLRRIRQLLESGAPVTPESRIQAGDRVRVRSGTFAGFEGVVIRRQRRRRLLVAVRFLQQGASVELDECELEWID
jgi:transcription antitermination factor NusG